VLVLRVIGEAMTTNQHRDKVEALLGKFNYVKTDPAQYTEARDELLDAIRHWKTDLDERGRVVDYSTTERHNAEAAELRQEQEELRSIRERIASELDGLDAQSITK
jgi:hypothetical protein